MERTLTGASLTLATLGLACLIATPLALATGQPPHPPTVSCTAQSDGVHVTWTAASGATSYNVWRKVGNNGAWINIGTTTGTSWTDHTAASGQLYHYAVSAINGNGESERGGTCNVTSIPFFPGLFALGAAVLGSAIVVGVTVARRRRST